MLCPSEDELLDYSANRMGVSDQGRLSFHIATCVVCAEALEALRDEVVDEFVGRQVGNYVVERRLGAGAMGVVYAAVHPDLGRRAAVKVISNPPTAKDIQRFFNEARACAAIRHAHIVDVLDQGRLPEGAPYLLMELLEGETVGARLAREGPMGLAEVGEIVAQTASALEAVHARHIVHRDLKPDNLFLCRRPEGACFVKVLDFGLAKGGEGAGLDPALTSSGMLVGTPLYMAPECLGQHGQETVHSDQYALAAVAYELLTGRPPYAAQSLRQLIEAQLKGAPPPASTLRPGLPPALDAVLARGLLSAPGERFEDVGRFSSALQAALAGGEGQERRRGWRGAAAYGALVAVLLLSSAVWMARSRPPRGRVEVRASGAAGEAPSLRGPFVTPPALAPVVRPTPAAPPRAVPLVASVAPVLRADTPARRPVRQAIRIESTPPGASLCTVKDLTVLGRTPFVFTGPSPGGERLFVQKAGYRTAEVLLPKRSRVVTVGLAPLGADDLEDPRCLVVRPSP